MWSTRGDCVLGSKSQCHLPLLCHWVTEMQNVGDVVSSDVMHKLQCKNCFYVVATKYFLADVLK
jgi:hypothetical protein